MSVAFGTAIVVVLHALRLPQTAGAAPLSPASTLRERLFSYGLAVSGVFTWHGVWQLWEVYGGGDTVASGLGCHLLGLGGLLALRCFRSTIAPPAVVALDDDPAYGSIVPTLQTAMHARGLNRLWE